MYRRRYPRRRTSRMQKLRRYGSRLRRGLDVTVQPGTVRDFDHDSLFDDNYPIGSRPVRINGLGKYSNFEDFSLSADYRYVQCCALYSEVRILSMNVEITMNGISGTNYTQTDHDHPQPVEELSRMFIMATVNRVTGNTMNYWTYDLMKNAPGTIISRSRNAYGYPRLSITIFPTTLQERTSWFRCGLRTDGCNAYYASGNVIPFSPSVDYVLVCPGGVAQKWFDPTTHQLLVSCSVVCRYRLMFRNAAGHTASSRLVLTDEVRMLENEMQQTDIHVTLPRFEKTEDKKKKSVEEEDPNVHYPTHEEAIQMEEDGDDFGGGGAGHVVGTDGVVVDDDEGEHFQRVPTSRMAQLRDTIRDLAPGAAAAAAATAAAVVAAQAERAKNKVGGI